MIVSYEHRFLFTHIPKTGGTSVRAAMGPYGHDAASCWQNRMFGRVGIDSNLLLGSWQSYQYRRHSRADKAQQKMPERVFDSLFKFCFVRNPFELLVSNYCSIRSNPADKRHHAVGTMEFGKFVDYAVRKRIGFQLSMIKGRDGRVLMNYVGRFERIEEDFLEILQQLCLTASLPHLNISEPRDFRTFYDEVTIAKVSQAYAEDIDAFGYRFDNAAPVHRSRLLRVA